MPNRIVERIAKAMYETPMYGDEATEWPPAHPDDYAHWISLAEAAVKEIWL